MRVDAGQAPIMDRAAIASRIPHQGCMCLLDAVLRYDDAGIACTARSHLLADNPLRHNGVLGAALGVEYAAQAMALHCALLAGNAPRARSGYLTSVRSLELHANTLDETGQPLLVEASRLALNDGTAMYQFTIHAGERLLAQGRLSAVIDAAGLAAASGAAGAG
ncbi:MAG: hydroxymyristoyl-ACP dehydratase [Brachymonas sp.]|nr:hydroxymyristoyl-ACP dehydratase [Brachymonas sp.]